MKRKIYSCFSYISISYTIILLCCSVTQLLLYGKETGMSSLFPLQVFLFPCICWLFFELTERISLFEQLPDAADLALRILIDYLLYLLFARLWNWFSFTVPNLILFTLVFFGIEAAVRRAFYLKMKQDENDINRLLRHSPEE